METWISGGSRRSIWGPNLKSPLSMTRETCRGIPTRAESHRNAVSQILSLLKILTLVLTGLICNDFFKYQESPFDGHKHTVKSVLAGPRQKDSRVPSPPPGLCCSLCGTAGTATGEGQSPAQKVDTALPQHQEKWGPRTGGEHAANGRSDRNQETTGERLRRFEVHRCF